MRIAFDHQAFTWQSYGGISRYYTVLAKQLFDKGHDISIFAPFHCNNYLEKLPIGIVQGKRLQSYPPKTKRLFLAANHFFANRKILLWKADIVHETYYSSMPMIFRSCPTIVTVYDMIHELFSEMFPDRDKTTRWKQKALKKASHIISISYNTKRDLLRLFDIEESKITVIQLGVNAALPHILSNITNFNNRPYILYVGGRRVYKNFNLFVRAFSSSKNLINDFDIVAFGGGEFSSDEKQFFHSLGLNENQIQQVDGSDELLFSYYAGAKLFVYPSLYEGFGLPLLEAMSYNCPVACSNTSSMPEIIGDAAEFFDPTNLEDIKKTIENVVYSDEKIMQLQTRGAQRVKLFTWEKCAEKTIEVYDQVIAS